MSIYIDVPHAYFEMARAIFNVLNVEMKKWEEGSQVLNDEQKKNIQLSMVSTIIIQCYMTIEAFINEGLKDLWEKSRKFEKDMNELKPVGIVQIQNAKPRYHEFYKKYGRYDNFEHLTIKTNLSNLGERIKIICKTRKIPQIHESYKETWDFFKKMETLYRHFLIHIYPDNIKFNDLLNDIFSKKEIDKCFETVQIIISHFYSQNGDNPPEWLKDNTLYNFSGIDYL